MATTGAAGGMASADTVMTGLQLDALMTGKTVYLTEPIGGGEIVLW